MEFVLKEEMEEYGSFNHEKILLVDDNDTNIFVVKTILEDRGLIVDTALCGREGIERYRASKEFEYKIIFLDINMYDIDGYEVSKEIRMSDREDAAKIPVYALSANIFAKDRIKAKESGMNGYVTKPIIYKTLFGLIREIIEKDKGSTNKESPVQKLTTDKTIGRREEKTISESNLLENIGGHFIFNALNTIKGSVIMKSENSCSLINDLSVYMQYRFKTLAGEVTSNVSKELFYLEAYLRLEKARFSYINYEINIFDEEAKELSLPAMSLIFLAENAIHHGLLEKEYDMCEKALVNVCIVRKKNETVICIEDNGLGFDNEAVEFSTEFGGISYIADIFKEICNGELEIDSERDKGTKVILHLTSWRKIDENDCGR